MLPNGKPAKVQEKEALLRPADKLMLLFSLVCCVVIAYFLFFFTSETRRYDTPIGVMSSAEKVKRRHARSLNWSEIGEGRKIYKRDIVYTPKGVSAVFVMNNQKTIEVEPDTMIQFEEIDLDSIDVNLFGGKVRGQQIQVRKKRETFKLRTFDGGRLLAYLEDTEGLILRQQELSSRLRENLKAPNMRSIARRQKDPKPMGGLRHYRLNLYRPVNHEELTTNSWIDAVWAPVPMSGIRFVVEVDKSKKFRKPRKFETKNNQIQLKMRDEGTYYWRVTAVRGKHALKSELGRVLLRKGRGLSVLRRMPSTLTGLNYQIATDKKFEDIIKSAITEYEKCPQDGLKPGRYYCRLRNVTTEKVLRKYRFRVK